MRFLEPIWLVVVIPAAAALLLWPAPSRLLRALRWAVLLLLVAALASPVLRLHGRGGVLVVVADRSESMPPDAIQKQKPLIEMLNKKRREGENLAVIGFGQQAATEMFPGEPAFIGFNHDTGQGLSNLHDGLQQALDLIPEGGSGRVVVFSDGQWSGSDPAAAAARAALRGIALDYHLQQRPRTSELAILQFDGPDTVERGQAYMLTAWFEAPAAGPVQYELKRSGRTLAQGTTAAVKGRNRLVFRELATAVGTTEYKLSVKSAAKDAVPENNEARLLVSVRGPRPVLCLSPTANSGLAAALRASGLDVVNARAGDMPLTLAELSRYTAVILENVPARTVGTDSLANVAAWVRTAGGGLMLTGGEQGYGQGGYMRSPVDPLLPVSLEMRREHRKMNMALAVSLDRSGSMSMPAGGGRTKMDLANLGTIEVINLLADFDHIGVVAVDSSPHIVVPMGPVAAARAEIGRVRRIESMGGGIFIYEALRNAAGLLSQAPQKNKHIILFADASDSEEPGDYKTLIATCRAAGVTISVVGLGTEKDCDAELLKDIAKRGGGRIFFSARPDELPALFAQETFAATGSSFSDQPMRFQFTSAWTSLGGLALKGPPPLDGYNICFLKKDALPGALTADKEATPVVAFWHAGNGRVLCYMGEADGRFGAQLARWDRVGDFFTTLARWTAGTSTPLPDGMIATRSVRNGLCIVDLYLDPQRAGQALFSGATESSGNKSDAVLSAPAESADNGSGRNDGDARPGRRQTDSHGPQARVAVLRERPGQEPQRETLPLNWLAPDQLRCEIPLNGRETVLPVLELPDGTRQALPPACLPFSPEFAPQEPGKGPAALRKLAEATGGREVLELVSEWDALPRVARDYPLRPALLLSALALFLVEILQRRTGLIRLPARAVAPALPAAVQAPASTRRATAARPIAPGQPVAAPPSAAPAPATPAPTPPDSTDVFRKARASADRLTRR